ncbi:MAG: tRNA (adenosine(37)-N6)-dimethylallyltransferase MiaA [Desulfopila sp.]
MRDKTAIALVGPTAIGKTSLSLILAKEFDCEIVSVDSMQVYRYMDVGTAKIHPEEMMGIPHHLLDLVDPDEHYDAASFARDAERVIESITLRGKVPLLTGGTGLYLKALTGGLFAELPKDDTGRKILQKRLDIEGSLNLHQELMACDPPSAARIHHQDGMRIVRGLEIYMISGIPWSTHLQRQQEGRGGDGLQNILQIALYTERDLLYDRINRRSVKMVEHGLAEEVQHLLAMGYSQRLKPMKSIGYRHMLNYLGNRWTMPEMLALLSRDTRRYAKRQYTWFRGIAEMEWFDLKDRDGIQRRIASWLASR